METSCDSPPGTLIERVFGSEIANLVRAVTEDKSLPWTERKQTYIDRIATVTAAVRLICAADKLHNLRTMLTHLRIRGDDVWTRFKGGRDKSLWYYEAVLRALREATSDDDPPQLAFLVEEVAQTVLDLREFVPATPSITTL